jgi:hypothetical protein
MNETITMLPPFNGDGFPAVDLLSYPGVKVLSFSVLVCARMDEKENLVWKRVGTFCGGQERELSSLG